MKRLEIPSGIYDRNTQKCIMFHRNIQLEYHLNLDAIQFSRIFSSSLLMCFHLFSPPDSSLVLTPAS